MLAQVQQALKMGSKHRLVRLDQISWFLDQISWLLLLLLASPLRPADFGNMFQYTDPGASFSWSDEMMSDVIAIVNTSGTISTHCDSTRNCSSGYHPLVEDQSLSHFKVVGRKEPCVGLRGSNGTTVTLSYETSFLTLMPDATLGRSSRELSYTFWGPANRSVRCFPGRYERKDDVCTIYDARKRPWYLNSISVEKEVKVVIDSEHFRVASNPTFSLTAFEEVWNTNNSEYEVEFSRAYFDLESLDSQKISWIQFCEIFDSRRQPLYSHSYARKQHRILIDSGTSMGAPVRVEFNRAPGTSYLNVAQAIAAEFLKTLPPQDNVNVYSFNATGAHPLNSQMKEKFHGAKNLSDFAELSSLSASIAKAYIPTSTEKSNLSTAILDVIPTFQVDKLSSNVILVFSDGNFESLCLWPELLAALQIRVMLYILPYNSDMDQFVLSTKSIPALLSEANGHFEMLDATSTINPLYWIQGYFSFLAQVQHGSVPHNFEWDNRYLWLLSKESSVADHVRSVFSNDDMLLGVEGIDMQLEDLTNELQMLLKQYSRQKTHDKLFQIVLKFQFCNRQIESENDNVPSCTSSAHSDGSYCRKIYPHQIHELSCCGSCNMKSNLLKTSFINSSKLTRLNFIFIYVILSSIVISIVVLMRKQENFVFFNYHRKSNELNNDGEAILDETDPITIRLYENRNDGIILESLNSQSSQGSSGIVLKVKFLEVVCAMKTFYPHAKYDFLKESTILHRLRDDHIVKFYCSFGDSTILMELMDKDLFTFIKDIAKTNNNYNLPLEVALEIMLQIAQGMSYLHKSGIAHQDLKSKNILVKLERQDNNFGVTVKVADFGSARIFDPSNPKGFVLFPNVNFGTRAWKAPELFHQKRSFIARLFGIYPYVMPMPLDIYGFGIICHEIVMGQVPTRAGREPPSFPSGRCPEGLVTLIKDCCQTNPLQRPEFDVICKRLMELISTRANSSAGP